MSPKEGFQYGVVDGPGLPLLEENLKRYKGLKFSGTVSHSGWKFQKMHRQTPKDGEMGRGSCMSRRQTAISV